MKKNLKFRIFLFFGILLCCGYHPLFASNTSSNEHSFSVLIIHAKSNTCFEKSIEGTYATCHLAQPFQNSYSFKLRATDNEVEEDEQLSSRKELITKKDFSSYYQTITSSTGSCTIKKKAVYKTVFNDLISYKRYVFFQVFRI
ncbi:hypothetical protein [Flavobacterium sp. UMI-01]|uniref:hypothetical protein n=1 Tax=Flavobacterium sp. UMI-01 TaxID=1441053 RepID=UPI001C7D6A25|nr:hypothetical protein [Flavobacterium sp. UMI-01]GIZ07725.1 hypothetical protein FUMI01_04520 [Flavobacterium sp. UMI-01]